MDYETRHKKRFHNKRRRKTPNFDSAIKRAKEMGADLTVAPDGSMTFKFASSAPNEANNPWDAEIEKLNTQ